MTHWSLINNAFIICSITMQGGEEEEEEEEEEKREREIERERERGGVVSKVFFWGVGGGGWGD